MSRDPKDLTEQMQGFYARFKAKMDAAGQRFILTATYRPQVEQDALFAQGRSETVTTRTVQGWN